MRFRERLGPVFARGIAVKNDTRPTYYPSCKVYHNGEGFGDRWQTLDAQRSVFHRRRSVIYEHRSRGAIEAGQCGYQGKDKGKKAAGRK